MVIARRTEHTSLHLRPILGSIAILSLVSNLLFFFFFCQNHAGDDDNHSAAKIESSSYSLFFSRFKIRAPQKGGSGVKRTLKGIRT